MKKPIFGRVAAGLALVGVAFPLCSVPASASTLNGIATITDASLTPLTSGGSATPFSVALPANAACTGDTATGGYHVYSYLVPLGTTISAITFTTHPSTGLGLVNNTGLYYGPINTAITTGQIISIPTNFEWGPLLNDGATLASLLYSGGTSGAWDAGLACANSSGTLTDYWNTQVTFTASTSDSNGFVWTTGPSSSTPEVSRSLVLLGPGVIILGSGLWFSRRRSARKAALAHQTSGA
jgi:hypothetical protein